MIDSGSPLTTINYKELQNILHYETLFVRSLPEGERCVNNKMSKELLTYWGIFFAIWKWAKNIFGKQVYW